MYLVYMAELAIPAAALAGLYFLKQKPEPEHINTYKNNQSYTDRYHTKDKNQFMKHKNTKNTKKKFTSLTGDNVEHGNLKHNNMQPYFGSHIKHMAVEQSHVLDNKIGTGSLNITKKEIAPLFTPSENAHLVGGTPNSTDFRQSREVGSRNHTDKGWQEIQVGPGLAEGYGTSSVGGYNNVLNARDYYMDKNVDELRTKNNPKMSFRGEFGPAKNFINNMGKEGKVEKNRPDTSFEHGENRIFGGFSDVKKNTMRSEQMNPCTQRQTTSKEYYGVSKQQNGDKEYVKSEYRDPHKCKLESYPILNPHNSDAFGYNDNTYGVNGYKVLPNNRSLNKQNEETFLGAAASMIGAVTMPFRELLRPTKKENLLKSIENSGNIGMAVGDSYYINPNDRVKTTRKETTINNTREMMINGSHLFKSSDNNTTQHRNAHTTRSQTSKSYKGIAGGNINSMVSNYAEQNANINLGKEKTLKSHPNPGNISILNSDMNLTKTRINTGKKSNRPHVPELPNNKTPSVNMLGEVTKNNNTYSSVNRMNPDILKGLNNNPYSVYF